MVLMAIEFLALPDQFVARFAGCKETARSPCASLFSSRLIPRSIRRARWGRFLGSNRGPAHRACVTGDSIRLGPPGYPWSVRKPGRLRYLPLIELSFASRFRAM